MNDIIKNIEAAQLKEVAPEFHVGDTVKVYGKIKEGNRERVQIFEGTVLKLSLIHIFHRKITVQIVLDVLYADRTGCPEVGNLRISMYADFGTASAEKFQIIFFCHFL